MSPTLPESSTLLRGSYISRTIYWSYIFQQTSIRSADAEPAAEADPYYGGYYGYGYGGLGYGGVYGAYASPYRYGLGYGGYRGYYYG